MTVSTGEIRVNRAPGKGPAGFGLAVMSAVAVYAIAPFRGLAVPVLLGAAVIGLTLFAWRHRETRAAALGGLVLAAAALLVVAVLSLRP